MMTQPPKDNQVKLTHTTMRVLKPFLDQPKIELSGADISRQTNVFSGSLYPILIRLEAAGWLTSHWENVDPTEVGRPRRRYYRITALGQRLANDAFAQLNLTAGALAWQR